MNFTKHKVVSFNNLPESIKELFKDLLENEYFYEPHPIYKFTININSSGNSKNDSLKISQHLINVGFSNLETIYIEGVHDIY